MFKILSIASLAVFVSFVAWPISANSEIKAESEEPARLFLNCEEIDVSQPSRRSQARILIDGDDVKIQFESNFDQTEVNSERKLIVTKIDGELLHNSPLVRRHALPTSTGKMISNSALKVEKGRISPGLLKIVEGNFSLQDKSGDVVFEISNCKASSETFWSEF